MATKASSSYNPHAVTTCLVIVFGLFAPNQSLSAESSSDHIQRDPAEASVTVPIDGSFVFWQTSKIATPVIGRIASLPVRVGDHVKKGDVVAQIDTDQLEANLAVAQSQVKTARSALGVTEAELTLRTTIRDRLAKLKQSKSPGLREASLEDANNSVAVASAAVQAAKAQVEAAEAEVSRQQVNVDLATIKAPFDGVVVRHLLTVGGLVSEYDPSVLVMVDDSSAEIEIEIPIEFLSSISVGMQVPYSLNSGARQQAKVRAILPSVTPGAKSRIVRLVPEPLTTQLSFPEAQKVTVYLLAHQ